MTTGAPITMFFENKNTRSGDYAKQRAFPRPGHADFVAHKKYGGYEDYRGGGHFSARLTVGIVAAGVLAKSLLQQSLSQTLSKGEGLNTGIMIQSYLTEVGGEPDVEKGLQKAIEAKDSVGGIAECRVTGLPLGLGEPFWDSIESVMSHAMFAIPAVKGVEFGAGFAAARMFGSQHNDAIEDMSGKTATNNAGGIVGGISNGNELVFRIAIKPTSSTPKEQLTLNWETGQKDVFSVKGRHDLCVALRATPIVEAMAAIVLADFMMLEQMIPRRLYPHFYHVTKKANWEKALQEGFYTAPSLESEGFIHNSKAGQVAGVLERYYRNETDLVKLTIDPSKLKSELKYELAPSVNEWFPHVFGPINNEAVVAVEEL
jgi:chorismate synthase